MADEKSNVIPLTEVIQKALPRMSDEYLHRIGETLKAVKGQATPKDQWVYHLYSGLVSEKLHAQQQAQQLNTDRLNYIEALHQVLERVWLLEQFVHDLHGPNSLKRTFSEADLDLIESCRIEVEKRSQPLQENNHDPEKTH